MPKTASTPLSAQWTGQESETAHFRHQEGTGMVLGSKKPSTRPSSKKPFVIDENGNRRSPWAFDPDKHHVRVGEWP